MELILNQQPKFTKKHLDFFRKHEESYGCFMSDDQYHNELKNINNDDPTIRCAHSSLCYEIHDIENYVGDLIINETNEIDILIFDEFSGNGYAYGAIKLYIEAYYIKGHPLEAVIRNQNENKEKVKKILLALDFKHSYYTAEENEVLRYLPV